jgi:hypothetical protein
MLVVIDQVLSQGLRLREICWIGVGLSDALFIKNKKGRISALGILQDTKRSG